MRCHLLPVEDAEEAAHDGRDDAPQDEGDPVTVLFLFSVFGVLVRCLYCRRMEGGRVGGTHVCIHS